MAGSIKRYFESTKNKLAKYADLGRIAYDMGAGGCGPEFNMALEQCDREWHTRSIAIDRKPAELVPVSVESCVKATAALRQCMQRNPDFFREHIAAMDKSIVEDERRRREPDVEVEDGPRFRW